MCVGVLTVSVILDYTSYKNTLRKIIDRLQTILDDNLHEYPDMTTYREDINKLKMEIGEIL